MRLEVAGMTHVGMKRTHNEDNYLVLPEEALLCVADGMGGHSSGEIASKIAIEEISEFFKLTSRDEDATWPFKMDKSKNYDENRLATGIKLANARIYERANSENKYKGMGTTIASVYFASNLAYVAHVGDSRVYSFRDGELSQLTEDHSLLNDYLKAKKLTAEEVEAFPHKNVIVRALGMKDTVQIDIVKLDANEADLFLLCSDGLSGMVTNEEIQQMLLYSEDLQATCNQLIDLANSAGGNDNVTCVLARYHLS
jgi:PPM family protein phosphatase